MKRIVIFGNSGSGKSTLAKHFSEQFNLAHLDLDTLAWQDTQPPTRLPISESKQHIDQFLKLESKWVIEGCYGDLINLILPSCNELYFLNLSVEDCLANARNRPWEPHKYASKKEQDANLTMLLDWIAQYSNRVDEFSLSNHMKMFDQFGGNKHMVTHNQTLPQQSR